MTKPLTQQQRLDVKTLLQRKVKWHEICVRFNISTTTIARIAKEGRTRALVTKKPSLQNRLELLESKINIFEAEHKVDKQIIVELKDAVTLARQEISRIYQNL